MNSNGTDNGKKWKAFACRPKDTAPKIKRAINADCPFVSPIFEISNRFVEDLVQLAILNKEILGKDNTFSLNEADDCKSNKDSLLTPRSKDPSTERTNQIMKRRRSMPGNNCDRGVDLKPQKTMR